MRKWQYLSAKQTLVIGFLLIILIGAFLLMLPGSSRNKEAIPFLNALFTSASATCVTGLVVYDTWTQFSAFGQAVILMLIQIGGLGFMTFAILISMALRKRIGLKERTYLMEAINAMQLGGVVRLVKHVLLGTMIFEITGAALLALRFCPMFGLGRGIWFGVFHSVSAFCNAGFDLMGYMSPCASLTPFRNDVVVNFTVMCLIVVGGIGFVVWDDIIRHGWHFRRYSLHSKTALLFTGLLIVVSSLLFLITERNMAFAGLSIREKILAALFQSITPRTAGFNTVDISALSEGGSLLTILLMIIGAGPGSTAGGIKITTFAVLLLSVVTDARKHEDVGLFNRRLAPGTVRRAYVGAASYMLLAFCGCYIMMAAQCLPIKDAVFETFSALGTVGLSTGITQGLLPVSKLILIILMCSGRLGSLTVFMAIAESRKTPQLRNPEEKIIVG